MTDVTTLWRPTGPEELRLVAESGWTAWPPRLPDQPIFYPVRNRWYATKIAREWNVPASGSGFVTRFDVETAFLDRYPVQQAGGRDVLEHWIPAEELDEFNRHIVGRIVEVAEFRGPLTDADFGDLLDAWRDYLRGESWLARGWLGDDTFVHLFTPAETAELSPEMAGTHPGIAIISGDGGRERLAIDLRQPDSPVSLVDITGVGWDDAVPQAESVAAFVTAIDDGTFSFRW